MSRRIAVLLILITAVVPASAAAKQPVKRCKASGRPTLLSFTPAADLKTAVVSWSRPRRPAHGTLRYRVLRDGAVVRQTRRTHLKLRVSPGRQYSVRVVVLKPSGKKTNCSAAIKQRVRRDGPTSPTNLAISDAGESAATLTWTPGRVIVGKLAGYRVFRDGEPLGQTKNVFMRVSLSSLRSYTFTVATVDSGGYLSAPSAPVTVTTGHAPPSAPGVPVVSNVSDLGFDLSWAPSIPSGGRIVGYRVYRDGTLLRQVAGASTSITGLAAAGTYSMSIVAVDSLGYLSDAGPSQSVTLAMPPPTTGGVHAFMLATTGQSFTDLREHYKQIGTLYPTYFECMPDGSISGKDDPLVTGWSQLRKIVVMPRLDCQNSSRLHLILTNPGVRGAMLDGLSTLAEDNGYDGLQIDFESGLATDRDALTSFITDLANLLHGQGKRLSVAVSAITSNVTTGRGGFYDYRALSAVADTVFVMNWGKHWSTSTPGAIADLPWATQVANYVATMPNKNRFVLGAGLYGLDWPAGGGSAHPATPLEWEDVQNLIAAVGATPTYDPVAMAPHFHYTDAQGVGHDVWYTDATSMAAQLKLARDRGLGTGFWRLGREDPALWDSPLLPPSP